MSVRNSQSHWSLEQVKVADDNPVLGGRPLTQIAAEVGTTPFYAYDRQAITDRVQALRDTLPESVHLHYAMKANPMPAVVCHLVGIIDGMDVASAGELRIALESGARPELVSFAGPGKTPAELDYAVSSGVVINMESEREMDRIARLATEQGLRPRVAIRINPDFELKTSGMKMAGGAKPFGVDAERVPAMLEKLAALDLEFVGFHIRRGSQHLRAEAICEPQTKTGGLAAMRGA